MTRAANLKLNRLHLIKSSRSAASLLLLAAANAVLEQQIAASIADQMVASAVRPPMVVPMGKVEGRRKRRRQRMRWLDGITEIESTRLNSSHSGQSRMPSSA